MLIITITSTRVQTSTAFTVGGVPDPFSHLRGPQQRLNLLHYVTEFAESFESLLEYFHFIPNISHIVQKYKEIKIQRIPEC